MFKRASLLTVYLSFLVPISYADSFAIFSEHEKLKDNVIIEVGVVNEIKNDFYSIGSYCFSAFSHISNDAALLFKDTQQYISLALLKSELSSVKVKVETINLVQCPGAGSKLVNQYLDKGYEDCKKFTDPQEFSQCLMALSQKEIDRANKLLGRQ